MELLKTARGLSPFDLNFRNLIDAWTLEAAKYEYLVAQTAMIERAKKRLNAQLQKAKLEESVPMRPSPARLASQQSKAASESKAAGSRMRKRSR